MSLYFNHTLITLCRVYSTCDQNFDFKIRREHQKNVLDRRAYESIDGRSLAISGYIPQVC